MVRKSSEATPKGGPRIVGTERKDYRISMLVCKRDNVTMMKNFIAN